MKMALTNIIQGPVVDKGNEEGRECECNNVIYMTEQDSETHFTLKNVVRRR